MAFKSFSVALATSNTDVIECPATTQGAAVLMAGNVSGGALTYTLKIYRQATGQTVTVISAKSLAANTAEKVPAPISLEAGDKVVMLCSSANNIVVTGTFTYSATVPVATGFDGRGEWDDEATYVANDVVSLNGNSYLALSNEGTNLNQNPETATDFWMLFAEKGDTGDGDLTAANNLNDLANKPTALNNIGGLGQGKHTIPWMASGMIPRTTNGPSVGIVELSTNRQMLHTLDFDQTTEEGAGFWVPMPKSWDAGTVTFQPIWTTAGGTGGVVWSLAGRSYADDDAIDAALGTAQTSTDTRLANNDMHIGPESSAITVSGGAVAGEPVYFEIRRVVADGSDTLTSDAKLIGIKLYISINATTDA